ncbi:MAG TPA: hypothetical protein DDY13_10680 [Cytophagales bacterium]|jgi:hypothetical protein|nr:hypothetical protein [Cytophagales bacterium]
MILFFIYLITLIWVLFFFAKFVRPFRLKKKVQQNKIKFIPLKKSKQPNKKFYVLNSGELVEVTH